MSEVSSDNFECGEILLSTAKSEYENENNRTSILDSKSNIVFTFASVVFVAMTQMVNIKKIFTLKITVFSDVIFPTLLVITLVSAFCSLLCTIILLVTVIFTKEYKTIDPLYFYDPKKLKLGKGLFSSALSQFYIEATLHNKTINDIRVRKYKYALVFMTISIICFVVYVFVANVI